MRYRTGTHTARSMLQTRTETECRMSDVPCCGLSSEKKAACHTSTSALVMRRVTNRNARAAMDAARHHRLASAPLKNAKRVWEDIVKWWLTGFIAVDRAAGLGGAVGAKHSLRLRPQSASAAAQGVSR